jgi:hypothetical protein
VTARDWLEWLITIVAVGLAGGLLILALVLGICDALAAARDRARRSPHP